MPLALLLVTLARAAAPVDGGAADVDGGVHVMDEKEMAAVAQSDNNVRLSLPTESDQEAWESEGLRVALAYGYAVIRGVGPAWSFGSHSAAVRPSVRLDRDWELGVTLLYGTGPSGLRWSVTAEPSLHVWRNLALSVGLGYAGLSVSDRNRAGADLRGADEAVSRTLSDAERLSSCTGSALAALGRAEYLFVVGPLFATGPFAQLQGQWTRCEVEVGRVDPETGRPVVLSQWWRQHGGTFGWWLSWR